ncbi:zinc finger protein 436-like [Anopheles bellator]|uniref:zinc finger protein 436-like n=1 Tax=Anopheles bellator TaxID=139047 RepID=UPI00264992DF|nr:zinc finger protein 436-like [Anopheles bellator]
MLIRQIVMGRHAIEQVYIVKSSLECSLYKEEAAIDENVVVHNECLEQEAVPKNMVLIDSPKHESSRSIQGHELHGDKEPIDIEDDTVRNVQDLKRDFQHGMCFICNSAFDSKDDLKSHLNEMHKDMLPYKCDKCPSTQTKSGLAMNRHFAQHLKKREFDCTYCLVRFETESHQKEHERQIHGESSGNDKTLHIKKARYVCRHCGKRLATMCSLEQHERKHMVAEIQKPQHNCYVCREHYSSLEALNQHLNIHADKLPYRCHICRPSEKGLTSVRRMNKHMAIHQKNIMMGCVYCEERFFTLKECQKHEQLVHGTTKEQLEATAELMPKRSKKGRKPFVSENSSKTIIVDGTKRYACAYCENSYSLLSTLRRHENTHTGAKQYTCKTCDKTFHKSSCLLYHQLTHTGINPYKCSQCGKGFKESIRLIEHRRCHTGEKPFQCKNCLSRFRIKAMLKEHLSKCGSLQTRIEECCCQLCKQTFSGYSELIQHTKETHNELLSAKERRCNRCDLCFKTMSAKLEHEFQHNQPGVIECMQCGRMFKQRANLIRHQKLHTEDALRFTCDVCGKSFSQAGALKIHTRTHTGERPYSCELCSERFHHSASVGRHKQLHYNINSKYYLFGSSTSLSSTVQSGSKKT